MNAVRKSLFHDNGLRQNYGRFMNFLSMLPTC
ncbi:hypothetical protein T4B_2002, partial [Trichinella pseudospiralis]